MWEREMGDTLGDVGDLYKEENAKNICKREKRVKWRKMESGV